MCCKPRILTDDVPFQNAKILLSLASQMRKVKLDDEKWELLEKDSTHFVKLSKIHVKGESIAWGKAETTIDASAEEVLAWFWDYCR